MLPYFLRLVVLDLLPSYKLKVRDLGKPVDLAGRYYKDGADEVCQLFLLSLGWMVILYFSFLNGGLSLGKIFLQVSFLNITGFRDFPLGDLPMLKVLAYPCLLTFSRSTCPYEACLLI